MFELPDPMAKAKTAGWRRKAINFLSLCLLASMITIAALSYADLSAARQGLDTAQLAASMLPSDPAPRKLPALDPKRKAYLLELDQTAHRLGVDWSSRLADLERGLGDDVRLNSFRLDAQRNEIEIKGEVDSHARLSALVQRLSQSIMEAKVTRVAGLASGFEYVLLISWPK